MPPLFDIPTHAPGDVLTGAQVDAALDAAGASTTGIGREQISQEARFGRGMFAQQYAEHRESDLGYQSNGAASVIAVSRRWQVPADGFFVAVESFDNAGLGNTASIADDAGTPIAPGAAVSAGDIVVLATPSQVASDFCFRLLVQGPGP